VDRCVTIIFLKELKMYIEATERDLGLTSDGSSMTAVGYCDHGI
jgi:hypothetical protein